MRVAKISRSQTGTSVFLNEIEQNSAFLQLLGLKYIYDCYLYMPEDVLELQLTFYFLLVLQHNSPALLLLSHQTKTKDLPLCCTSPPNSVNLKENTTSYSLSLRFMS